MTLEHYKAQEETARQFKELQAELQQAISERDAARLLCERLQAQADEIRSGSQWISVEDRLPRDGQLVIASGFIFRKVENGRWVEPAVYGDDAEFHPPTKDGNGETVADFDCDMNCTTHWMPLPASPTTSGDSHD